MLSLGEVTRPATFGRRRLTPRACVADRKRHIRTFLADALEELGFVTFECVDAADLQSALSAQPPDLIVFGLTNDGSDAAALLEMLAAAGYDGSILPIGRRDSLLATAVRQLATELGLSLLPVLS